MGTLGLFIFGLLLSLSMASKPECHRQGETLHCLLRTLSTNINNDSDYFPIEAASEAVSQVVLKCSDHQSESILRTNHFGYLPHLKKLSVTSCRVRRVPALAFSGLSSLTDLEFSQTGGKTDDAEVILEVESDAFTGLNSLQRLNFTSNNLWTLPEAVFCSLNSLTELNLANNFLQDVKDLGFSSSELNSCRIPLRKLDLSSNSLSSLDVRAFGQLRKLESLQLASNNLNVIDDGALGGLSTLINLNLAHNRFVALPNQLFAQTPYLQDLHLNNNSLSVLAPGLFDGLEHLVVLNMSRNELSNDWLTPQTFASLLRLVALDMSHNRLTKLESAVLNPLTSLQILDLSYNRLHTLTGYTFLSQVNLHSLQLTHNLIQDVHKGAFAGLSVLSSLHLGFNRIEFLEKELFNNCTSLVDLYLQGNLFRQVPTAVQGIKLLKTLDLGDNLLTNTLTASSLQGLDHLYGLRLAGNGIRSLNASLFKPVTKLQVLNLADNQLANLDPGVFKEIPTLRMLRLDNNQLEELNGILAGQTQLRFLNVSQNKLQWFDYAFLPKSLEWLDLHANQIEDLGNYYSLWSDFNLRYLDVSQNSLESLAYLSLLPSLQVVDLSFNKLSVVEAVAFANKTNLRRVDLRSNNIERLPLAALRLDLRPKGPSTVEAEFFLSGNPILCDCEMEWLQKINSMEESSSSSKHHGRQQRAPHARVGDLEKVQCRLNSQYGLSPPVNIMQVHRSQFVCPYQAHCFALCMCCDFFACDCRMQCPEGCSCFHDSTWSANVIQCSRRGHAEIPPLIPMDATSILLDGNNFTGLLESQAFIGRKRVSSLYLNASQIESIGSQTFNGLMELRVLHLEDNLIQALQGHEFSNLSSLRELFLERNRLASIDDMTFASLVSLELLHLHDNLLNTYPIWNVGSLLPSLTALTISGNPWTCQCKFVHKFHQFSQGQHQSRAFLADLVHVKCVADTNGGLISLDGNNVTCSDAMAVTYHNSEVHQDLIHMLPIAAAIIAVCIVCAVASILLFVFRTPLRVWLHSKYGIRLVKTRNEDKLYDAFVSYSIKDEDFVQQVLVPQMEHEADMPSYKLCLQHRDLPTSSSISDSFPGVSQLCAKHLLVVSRAYLESEWTQIKFALQDHKKLQPILILLEELSSLDLAAAPEFNLLMKAGPVLRWTDAGFWNKLRFYLPDSSSRASQQNTRLGIQHHSYMRNLNYHGDPTSHVSPKPVRTNKNAYSDTQWQYDGLLHGGGGSNGSSSTSTRSTTLAKPVVSVTAGQPTSTAIEAGGGRFNPLQQHSEDAYQSVVNEHIYHTLEPPTSELVSSSGAAMVDGTVYDSLCKLDVMLPNGQMVPATLVRNASGRVIPLVEVNSQTLPHQQQQSPSTSTPMSFASTTKNRILMSSNTSSISSPRSNNNRHFV